MKKNLICIIFFIMVSLSYAQINLENSIVKIITITNAPDYSQPWQMLGQSSVSGSGCIIPGERILTNAHVVSNSTFIQVNKSGETKKYVAEVFAIDHECDLAILKVNDREFFKNTQPIQIGEMPEIGDTVKVYGFPIGGDKLSVTKGIVSRIEITQYSHSLRNFISLQIDAAINPGNSGGPVIMNNKIIGVAFQAFDKAQNIGYAVPSIIIMHFLDDLKDGKYAGFPSLGIYTQNLENDAFRKKLGMKKGQTGVIVQEVEYGSSAFGLLKKNDVILSIDDIKIENDGTIPYKKSGRLDYSYLIDLKSINDIVTLEILRDNKQIKLPIKLKNYVPIVPRTEYDVKPTYYIFGGLVFVPLTVNYIYSLWNSTGNRPSLLDRIVYDIASPERQQILILQQVLADETNKGYHDFSNLIIKKVNDRVVKDIKELINIIENLQEKYLIIDLENSNQVILELTESKKATETILKRYGINFDRSEDLRE